ncbi:MAG: SDR family NAD(P)-dependent oxidoreductase [Myxococcota bacterium]
MSRPTLRARYGPWAVVAGASEGLGAAFAERLAAEGLHLVLLARRPEKLEPLGEGLRQRHGVEVRPVPMDLSRPDLADAVAEVTRELEVGLLVYNAAFSVIGPFLERGLDEHLRVVDVNVRGPIALGHRLGAPMAARGRGGMVLMTSMSGYQGSALITTYAASKAFNLVLGEGLWDELRGRGVDVVACAAGATRTPNYEASAPRKTSPLATLMEPEAVVDEALAALGRRPSVVPGLGNRLASFFMQRLLPRRTAIRTIGRATRDMYGD